MNKLYSRINWENFPSENTALNESNLNRMDLALDNLDNRVIEMDAIKVNKEVANTLIKNWSIDEKTGLITIEKLNGEKILFDLNIEKIPVDFKLSEDGILTMTTDDGTKFTANIGAMIPVLTFEDSDEIVVSVSGSGVNKTYSFSIKAGSVTEDKLQPNFLADVKSEVAKAQASAVSAATSETNAKTSETNSKASETAAKTSETNAKASETAVASSASTASTKASEASTSATNAANSANSASASASTAASKASSASSSATTATTKANEASASATSAATSETNAKTSETNSKASETAAKTSETNAKASEIAAASSASTATTKASEASTSATNAANSANSASASASTAASKASSASSSATTATTKANEASASATSAATSATNAKTSENNAQAYAMGATNSAKYYYEQSKAISESFSGALRPMGTVAFASLPTLASASEGDMYNVSNQFTTTADFKEGSGFIIPAGANVYKTSDGKWDILAGTPVTGVKGNKETTYRRGNVNITPENIGLGNVGDFKAVSTVASQGLTDTEKANARANIGAGTSSFSGSYNDLSNKPTIPAAVAVKGNAESSYRTGNVNLTPANIGALAINGDSKSNTVTFTSNDVDDASATSWTSVSKLATGITHATFFQRVSQMFKNVRYLYKMLGTTDISKIGNGTVTGALDTLNSNLNDKQNKIMVRGATITAPYGNTGIKVNEYNLIGAIEANAGALAIPFAHNGYYYIAIGTSSFTSVSFGTYDVALYLTQ